MVSVSGQLKRIPVTAVTTGLCTRVISHASTNNIHTMYMNGPKERVKTDTTITPSLMKFVSRKSPLLGAWHGLAGGEEL